MRITQKILDAFGLTTKALDATTFPTDLLAAPTLAGVSVTAESSLSVPAVANAVSLISGALGSLPLEIFEERDGGKISATDHPAYALVYSQPNEWTSASDLRRQLALDCLLHGNAYAVVNRLGDDTPFELLRLDPQSVTVYYDPSTQEPSYVHRPYSVGAHGSHAQANLSHSESSERTYHWRDVAHLKAPISLDGICGVSPIQMAREAIGLAITLEQYAARLFGNGARPSGVLTYTGKLDDIAKAKLSSSWNTGLAGANSGRTALLESGIKFEQLALASTDAQFLEMRQFAIVEIARAFGASPVMIGDASRATWSNAEQYNLQFVTYTLAPWLKNFEGAFSRVLLSPEDRSKFTIEFDTQELLRGDLAARGAFAAQMRASGVMTANELRAYEQLPRHADGDALDSPHVQSSRAAAPIKEAA